MKASEKKRPSQRTKEAKGKEARSKEAKQASKSQIKGREESQANKKDSKEDPTATTTQQPTHYAPSGSVPGPQFGDPKRQEG